MKTLHYLLKFPPISRYSGYIFVYSVRGDSSYNLKILLSTARYDEFIPVESFKSLGSSLSIFFKSNSQGYELLKISFQDDNWTKTELLVNHRFLSLESIDLRRLNFNPQGMPILPPLKQYRQKIYDFPGLKAKLKASIQPYGIFLSESHIFEHTLLRLANIPFSTQHFFRFGESKTSINYFFIDLGCSLAELEQFIHFYDEQFGSGTVVATPKFHRKGYYYAVLMKLNTMIDRIMPYWEQMLHKTLENLTIRDEYLQKQELAQEIAATSNQQVEEFAGLEPKNYLQHTFWNKCVKTIFVTHDVGFKQAIFITGAHPQLGKWQEATRLTYDLTLKCWYYTPRGGMSDIPFKFLRGAYDLGEKVATEVLTWENTANRRLTTQEGTTYHYLDFPVETPNSLLKL